MRITTTEIENAASLHQTMQGLPAPICGDRLISVAKNHILSPCQRFFPGFAGSVKGLHAERLSIAD